MFIVSPEHGDTTVLDSVVGHRKTFDTLASFLASREASVEIATAGKCHLYPDWPHARLFRMVKSESKLKIEELPDRVLQVTGRPELLARWIEDFEFGERTSGHHHPAQHTELAEHIDPTSADIIIEVDDGADDPDSP